MLADIEALKKDLRLYLREAKRWNGSLRRLSFARNVQGSNSIEGFNAALDDAVAVALGEDPLDADDETRLALEGYRDAMTYVHVGAGSWHPENDARPWLRFVLTAHVRQARTVLFRVQESDRVWTELEARTARSGLPERAIPGLWDAAFGLRVRNATYRATVAEFLGEKVSEQTATRDLKLLSDAKFLQGRGEKRGRYYIATEALRRIVLDARASRPPRNDSDPFGDPTEGRHLF